MRTVITYGTFDLFHQGHYNILKRAKAEGDYLIVGVTGETYDMERGKLSVQDSLAVRIENVRKTGFADKIIVEEYLGQKISDIQKYHVDVFVIGSDWKGKFDHIAKYCELKYLERTKNISSTQLRNENLNIIKLGIVTDSLEDSFSVFEPKVVSGVHVESVFSEDLSFANKYKKRYDLNKGFDDYGSFLEGVDIVSIHTSREKRYKYVKSAIRKGKHIICDLPITLDEKKEKEIQDLAEAKGVLIFGSVLMLYQHVFGQMLWAAKGNEIGDIISVNCVISKRDFEAYGKYDLLDLAYYPACAFEKILGTNHKEIHTKVIKDKDGKPTYSLVNVFYDNAVATAEISEECKGKCMLRIMGTEGEIIVPDEWWQAKYFRLESSRETQPKHYSSNFDGNGLRYLVQAMCQDIRNNISSSDRISKEEARGALEIVKSIKAHM